MLRHPPSTPQGTGAPQSSPHLWTLPTNTLLACRWHRRRPDRGWVWGTRGNGAEGSWEPHVSALDPSGRCPGCCAPLGTWLLLSEPPHLSLPPSPNTGRAVHPICTLQAGTQGGAHVLYQGISWPRPSSRTGPLAEARKGQGLAAESWAPVLCGPGETASHLGASVSPPTQRAQPSTAQPRVSPAEPHRAGCAVATTSPGVGSRPCAGAGGSPCHAQQPLCPGRPGRPLCPPQQLAPRPLPVPDKRPPDPLVLIPQRNGLQGARRAQSRLRERDREPVSNGGGAPAPGEGGRGPGPHSVPCPRHPKPWVSATRPDRRLLRRGKARGESFSGQRPPPAPSCPRGPHLRAANYRVHLSYSSSPWRARGRPGAAYVIHSYTYTHVRIHICSLTSLTTFCG